MNVAAHDFVVPDEEEYLSEEQPSWLDRYSVKKKVHGAILGSTLFLWLIACLLMAANLHFMNEGGKSRLNQMVDIKISQANVYLTRAQADLGDFIQSGDRAALASSEEEIAEATEWMANAVGQDADLPFELYSRASNLQGRANAVKERVLALSASATPREDAKVQRQEIKQLAQQLYELSDEINAETEKGTEHLFDDISRAAIFFGLLVLIAPAVAFWLGRKVARDVSDKIAEVTESAEALASGDTSVTIPGRNRQDEIGALSRALAIFRDTTLREADQQTKLQNAKERARSERVDALGRISQDFNESVGRAVKAIVSDASALSESTAVMSATSKKVTAEVSGSAKSMSEATVGVSSAAAASDEFALSIDEISKQASYSAEMAREAGQMANGANDSIDELSLHAGEIGDIVDLIQSIAQRTNLLALNASIEAARGGEAGRGFAVVASEVKELAARTAEATQKVSEKIGSIQNSTGSSVKALQTVVEQIAKLETASVSIASAVDQQSMTGRDLAKNIDVAANNADRVSNSLTQVERAVSTASKSTEEMRSSASDLERQALALQDTAERFIATIGEAADGPDTERVRKPAHAA